MEDGKFIVDLCKKWEENDIDYCILRKPEEIYTSIENDIDILVNQKQFKKASTILTDEAKNSGWNIHMKLPKDNLIGIHLNKSVDSKLWLVHIDLFENICWRGIPIIESKEILSTKTKWKDIFVANKKMRIIIAMLGRLFHGGYIKEQYKNEIREFLISDRNEFVNILKNIFDEELIEQLAYCIELEKWDDIKCKADEIRKSFIRKRFNKYIFYKYKYYTYLIKKAIKTNGICIALLGPDGSGKSTISEGILKDLKKTFPKEKTKVLHWRPGVLPQIRRVVTKGQDNDMEDITEPHKLEPYNKLISILRFIYYFFDYIVGFFIVILPMKAKGGLIIFDRYYYDYYVDKRRYRLNISNSVLRLFELFIPKPDIVFYLRCDPKIIYERKQELPLMEIERQIDEFDKTIKHIDNSIIIETLKDIDDVINEICINILKRLEHEI